MNENQIEINFIEPLPKNSIKIKWLPYDADDIFYEVLLINSLQNKNITQSQIKFIYKNKILHIKNINQIEEIELEDFVKKINLKIIKPKNFSMENEMEWSVHPDTQNRIIFETSHETNSIIWLHSDELNYPDYYSQFLELTNLIQKILDFDVTYLKFPIFP